MDKMKKQARVVLLDSLSAGVLGRALKLLALG
jgi:hypothetical protein